MPALSAWSLSLAMGYLLSGASAGAALMLGRATGHVAPAWLLPLHIEFMLAGWTVQLAVGMAYWILPRHKTGIPRGNAVVAWGAFAVFNFGVWLAALGGNLPAAWHLTVAGHAAEVAGVACLAWGLWQRLPRSLSPAGKSLPILG